MPKVDVRQRGTPSAHEHSSASLHPDEVRRELIDEIPR
jgi:hypothetical protein